MTTQPGQLHLALRERRGLVLAAAIWVLVTVVCALSGPFGTIDYLSLPGRFAYWALVVGVSVWGSFLPDLAKGKAPWQRGVLWGVFALGLSGFIVMLNRWVFGIDLGWSFFFYLLGLIVIVVLLITGFIWMIHQAYPAAAGPENEPDGTARFLERIPYAQRGPLVRIEAQDHYLNVVTTKGESLILMRFSDAAAELEKAQGLVVHRSHWIALEAVTGHKRSNGRDLLVMSDASEVPVSRSNRPAAKAAGLL